jgi:hypothetical protein
MKKTFTKLFSIGMLTGLTFIGFAVNAQSTSLTNADGTDGPPPTTVTYGPFEQRPVVKPAGKENGQSATADNAAPQEDTTWHPQRRVWGYTFGDFYYDAHSPAVTSSFGKENNYYQVPTYRNAFQFRRLYLGYDYEITRKFKAEVLLSSEPTANTGTFGTTGIQGSDNLVDNHMAFWIKNFNIRVRDLWKGTDFLIGEISTPGFALNEPGTNGPTSLSETTWGYRSVERTITDFHKNNSFDVGAALQGTFDPTTKNFGYVLMASNNSAAGLLNANNPATGFYKIIYADLWGKFANNHVYADLYFHTARTAQATAAVGGQSNSMYKLFVAYLSTPFNIGIEPYIQTFQNGVTNKTTGAVESPTLNAFSIWVRGAITPHLNYFAKYDTYNPYTNFDSMDVYSVNTNYGAYDPNTKSHFTTFGIDINPTPNVHFMPNIWFIQYVDQTNTAVSGYVPNNHTLVYRFTFFFIFGK